MSIGFKILSIFLFCVNLSASSDYGIKSGNPGVKSYGGVIQGANQNPGFYQSYNQMNQMNPMFNQPLGWNYNQPQRTYGGVMQPNAPQGFGWFGNSNQFQRNPAFPQYPQLPPLFLPNFQPPVYYPNTLPFPNYNPFPHYHGTSAQGTNVENNGRFPINQSPSSGNQSPPSNYPQHHNHPGVFPGTTHNHGHQNQNNNQNTYKQQGQKDQYATSAFFKPSTTNRQGWNQENEREWESSTKAPYFENKIPGMPTCTLPASAILGATTAMKASSLFPLNIPIGKPILSCNATDLEQTQISLNGVIYDCDRSSITKSCPRIDANSLIVDDCRGEMLECDVRMPQNTRSVSCTNGTLISNHLIVCKSATLLRNKNVLNCVYGGAGPNYPTTFITTSRPETTTLRTSPIQPAPVTEKTNEEILTRGETKEAENLMDGVKTAMKTVFPFELLSKAPSQMYLPPNYEMAPIPKEIKNHLVGIFPSELFAVSQMGDLNQYDNDRESGLSPASYSVNNRNQLAEQFNVNANKKSGNSGTFVKTAQRFGSSNDDDEENDRLIFSP